MLRPSIVVLAVDSLRASALGAYGNTWFQTPALDRLASESVVSDWFFADAHALPNIYRSLWTSAPSWDSRPPNAPNLVQLLEAEGYETVLVSDDQAIGEAPGADAFARLRLVDAPEPRSPAGDATDASTAKTLALLLDELDQCRADQPVFAWAHMRFAHGAWDAPVSLAERLLEEDDPRPRESVMPPSGLVDDAQDPEFAFESTLRYAAQVMALDACVRVVGTALDEAFGADGYALALLGVRGYALGEHGRVGPDDDRPYSEMRHVPLLVRPAGAVRRHRRSGALEASCQFAVALARTLGTPDVDGGEGSREVVLASPSGAAIQNDQWKLIEWADARRELYSKPDDRWEMNDVAVREALVVEELAGRLHERVAGGAS